MTIFERLIDSGKKNRAAYFILLDPDKLADEHIPAFMQRCNAAGVDAVLIGGSLLMNAEFDPFVKQVKSHAGDLPVILFPGSLYQISAHADAILFLSLVSGRQAQHLIGSQVLAAPRIKRAGLEVIPTAYMLIDCGRQTAAQFMSGTTPLPRNKPEIAAAHALAAQYLGFKMIYLEAGSGADNSVPDEMITAVKRAVELPVIVGGGIRTPEAAANKVKAGASFIVTGTVLEENGDDGLIKAFADAVHRARNRVKEKR